MKILGLDTGTTETGWAIYDSRRHRVSDMGIDKNEDILEIIKEGKFDMVSLEMIASYGMPVGKTTFETVYWIGRFAQMAENENKPYFRYYKKAHINPTICFNAKANDSNIRRALLDMFPKTGGGKEPSIGVKNKPGALYGIKTHIYPALAVAITHSIQTGLTEYQVY